jgi:hypothetical protein
VKKLLECILFVLLGTQLSAQEVHESAVKTYEPIFSCQLSPIRFVFYYNDYDSKRPDLLIFQDGKSTVSISAEVEVNGSGVCKYWTYTFDYKGFVQISSLGCFGEVEPPKTAVGTISFDKSDVYSRQFWCHR